MILWGFSRHMMIMYQELQKISLNLQKKKRSGEINFSNQNDRSWNSLCNLFMAWRLILISLEKRTWILSGQQMVVRPALVTISKNTITIVQKELWLNLFYGCTNVVGTPFKTKRCMSDTNPTQSVWLLCIGLTEATNLCMSSMGS